MDTAPVRIPTFSDVEEARRRIAGTAQRTPVLTSRTADERARAHLFFKAENLQRVGAFKFRGAFNALAALGPGMRTVVAYSSGNHAQAVACAAQLQGKAAVIIMPHDAPAIKVAATRGYGAEIVFYDRYTEDRAALAAEVAARRKAAIIPPYDHPDVVAGQGTAGLELLEDAGPLDLFVTPLGGGGLLAGCALAAKALSPGCRVVGVEPEAGNDGQQSLARGEIVHIAVPKSIADGALTTHLGRHTFPILRDAVDEVVTVSDAQLVETMRFFAERMKLIVEPTGCLAAAALLQGVLAAEGKRVGVVLSGGNVDLATFGNLLN